ncbi:MAG TPA: hypothetical protein VEK57_18975 [Thermoanaerobaculia bacterium]|nr:hypothetical protein [Thermoanaerobaculia bacterium]
MPKYLRVAFTGNAVLTPDYPDDYQPIFGPLTAVMPGARQRRPSTFRTDPIHAQFAFLKFPYPHLVLENDEHRDADYKFPDVRDATTGLCFLEREELRLVTPASNVLTFDPTIPTHYPTTASTETEWVARWRDFALGGNARLRPGVLTGEGDYVRVVLPGGDVTASFVGEPIARIDFDYGAPYPRVYAQEIVVTLTFDDSIPSVILEALPFQGTGARPSFFEFRWYDSPEISIQFGNGSMASIENVLRGSFAGLDHEGDFDLEFEVLYDIVDCNEDDPFFRRLPVPRVISREVLRIPCIATMLEPQEEAVFASDVMTSRALVTPAVTPPVPPFAAEASVTALSAATPPSATSAASASAAMPPAATRSPAAPPHAAPGDRATALAARRSRAAASRALPQSEASAASPPAVLATSSSPTAVDLIRQPRSSRPSRRTR